MSNTQKIEALRKQAQNTEDPETLDKIAGEFRLLGDWDDWYKAERKAREAERKQADEAAR